MVSRWSGVVFTSVCELWRLPLLTQESGGNPYFVYTYVRMCVCMLHYIILVPLWGVPPPLPKSTYIRIVVASFVGAYVCMYMCMYVCRYVRTYIRM